jgi:hypothetical protein
LLIRPVGPPLIRAKRSVTLISFFLLFLLLCPWFSWPGHLFVCFTFYCNENSSSPADIQKKSSNRGGGRRGLPIRLLHLPRHRVLCTPLSSTKESKGRERARKEENAAAPAGAARSSGTTVDEASRERNKRLIKRPAGTTPIPSIDLSCSPNCKFQCETASMFIELKVAPTVVLRNLLKLSLEFNIHMVAIFCSSQSLKVHTICLKKLIILRGNNLFEHPL